MDIGQLLAFERIAREGSFSRAARQLDITQPTISGRIQTLEQELGGPLFVRGGRKLTLTERGENFLSYVQRALEVLNEGIEVARLSETGQHGRITVGTLQALAGGFLAESAGLEDALQNWREPLVRGDFPGPADGVTNIVARQVAHGQRTHGKPEVLHHPIDLLGCRALFQQKFGLAHIELEHAIANEAIAIAGQNNHLVEQFPQ